MKKELQNLIEVHKQMLNVWEEMYNDLLKNANEDNEGQRKVLFGKIHGLSGFLHQVDLIVNKAAK